MIIAPGWKVHYRYVIRPIQMIWFLVYDAHSRKTIGKMPTNNVLKIPRTSMRMRKDCIRFRQAGQSAFQCRQCRKTFGACDLYHPGKMNNATWKTGNPEIVSRTIDRPCRSLLCVMRQMRSHPSATFAPGPLGGLIKISLLRSRDVCAEIHLVVFRRQSQCGRRGGAIVF